jgi:hypothetical protein
MAFGHAFRNFSYPHAGPLRSGETTPRIVTTPGGQFVIEDTYWTEDDYVDAVEQAGLAVTTIDYPGPLDGQNPSQRESGRISKHRVVLLERARGRQGADPVVVDALAVHELEP